MSALEVGTDGPVEAGAASVHDWIVEHRHRELRQVRGLSGWRDEWRAVCPCGWSTGWCQSSTAPKKRALDHALAGQQSWTV